MRTKALLPVVKTAVGLIVLAYVIVSYWEPEEETGVGLKSAFTRSNRWEYFVAAFACLSTCTSLTFVRWYWLVRAQGLPFTLRDAFRIGWVSYFFNTVLPGSVGGDVLKAAFIAREQQRRTVAVSTVLIDRGIGLWGIVALAALVGGTMYAIDDPIVTQQADMVRMVRAAVLFMALTFALWAFLGLLPERRAQRFKQRLLWLPKVGGALAEFWLAVWLYRKQRHAILGGLGMSIFGHIFTVLAFYFSALAFQPRSEPPQIPGIWAHFVIVPAGMAFQGFFPSPGGIGGGEFIFGLLYARLSQPAANGIWGSFGFRLNTWLLGFLGYVVYLFMKRDMSFPVAAPSLETSTNSNSPDLASKITQV